MPRPPRGVIRRGPSWYFRDRRGGKDRWIRLGRDYQEAVRRARKLSAEETPRSKLSVAEAVGRWLQTYIRTARNEKGQKLAEDRANQWLVPQLGHFLLERVRPDDLRLFRVALEKTHLSPQTVAHLLSDARCFFSWAEDSGLVDRSPVPKKLLPKIQERPPDRLSEAEASSVAGLPDPFGFVCRFGLASGLRWGELCRAQVSDISGGVLLVHQTKSGKVRRVPLGEFASEVKGRVGRLVPFSVKSSGYFTRKARELSGVSGFHPHQLRHTFACRWIERGGSLSALQQLLGHSSVVTTQRYAKLSDEAVQREAVRIQTVENAVEAAN